MEANQPVAREYVHARRALLDALEALEPHLGAVVLVGAQAVYVHAPAGVEMARRGAPLASSSHSLTPPPWSCAR